MKRILFVLSIIGILSSCSEKKDSNFVLKGKVEGMRKGLVYLKNDVNGNLVTVDSIFLKGTDEFEFSGNIETPEVYFLSTSRRNSSNLPIFIEKNEITVNADVKDLLAAEVTGSKNQELLEQFNKMLSDFNNRQNELYVKGLKADTKKHLITLKTLTTQYQNNDKKRAMYILNFAVKNGQYDISPYVALNYLSSSHITVLDTINKSMSDEVKNGRYGKELNELVTQLKATTVGNKLPEIIQPDTTGTKHTLENKSGYLLLKFWRSDDKSSKISNSLAVKLNEKYDSLDFKIISIALDTDKEKWMNSVKEENLPWLQVSDLKGNNNQAVRNLAIRVIPESVLIDENGIIVGRNMLREDIIKMVDNYIDNKIVEEPTENTEEATKKVNK